MVGIQGVNHHLGMQNEQIGNEQTGFKADARPGKDRRLSQVEQRGNVGPKEQIEKDNLQDKDDGLFEKWKDFIKK